jgi:hypothetical protein
MHSFIELGFGGLRMANNPKNEYSDKEATARFEAALKSALNTPHKPLKEKPKVKKAAAKPKKRSSK